MLPVVFFFVIVEIFGISNLLLLLKLMLVFIDLVSPFNIILLQDCYLANKKYN